MIDPEQNWSRLISECLEHKGEINFLLNFTLQILLTVRLQYETSDSDFKTHRNQKNFKDNLLEIIQDLESKVITFLKNELMFKKILQKKTEQFVKDFNENRCRIKEATLDLTLYFLREIKQDEALCSM